MEVAAVGAVEVEVVPLNVLLEAVEVEVVPLTVLLESVEEFVTITLGLETSSALGILPAGLNLKVQRSV